MILLLDLSRHVTAMLSTGVDTLQMKIAGSASTKVVASLDVVTMGSGTEYQGQSKTLW